MSGGNGDLNPEIKPEIVLGKSEPIKEKQILPGAGDGQPLPPTDFKIAEVWLRNGILHLDASENFWADKVRAIGMLEVLKDIVKQYQPPKEEKSKIIPSSHGVMDFMRGGFRRKK